MAEGFTHRLISGWISDYGSVPRMEPWPSITLDDTLEADLLEAFDLAATCGYTGVILWGLLAGRSWSPHLGAAMEADRRVRVLRLIEAARSRGLALLMGLGLYSWGFDEIIAADPRVDGGSASTMCGSRGASWEWMQRVIDYVFAEYDPDGVSMQSSDMGRCPCDTCRQLGSLEYHARLNAQATTYIRSRWPHKLIEISTWGMDLANPDDAEHVRAMCAGADILNDFNNSSATRGAANRRALAAALPCAFGTEGGWWLDPPPFWERTKWFVPLATANVGYLRSLREDGGRSVQRYILPVANPGAEVGLIFDGMILADPYRDPEQALAGALRVVFAPRGDAALVALLDVWHGVEDSFIAAMPSPERARMVGLSGVHYSGTAPRGPRPSRPEYLLRMESASLAGYGAALEAAAARARPILPTLARRDRADRLERSLAAALADVRWAQGVR
ncbi:MAG: hypothetical protein ACYC5O_10810 [Anaerolineae bacterium]